jgi:colanic acid/amylovoran biosynthesis protein
MLKMAAATDRMNARRILIVNLHSSANAGDAALTDMTLLNLRTAFPSAVITLALNDPKSHTGPEVALPSFFTWARAYTPDRRVRWQLVFMPWLVAASYLSLSLSTRFNARIILVPKARRALICAFLDADLVVSSPGHILYSSGKFGLSLLLAVFPLFAAIWANKPFYMMPQSYGPFRDLWERIIVRWVLNRARLIFVREPESLSILRDLPLPSKNIKAAPDLAFGCAPGESGVGERWLTVHGISLDVPGPLVGVTLINWGAQKSDFSQQAEYENAVVFFMKSWIENYDAHFVIFPQVTGPTEMEDDRVSARRVLAALGKAAELVTLIEEPVGPNILNSAIGHVDMFVGSRMHSNIFALQHSIPVLAISYHHKTYSMMQSLGLETWVVPIASVRGETLTDRANELWSKRRLVRAHLGDELPAIVDEASRIGKMIAADYAGM